MIIGVKDNGEINGLEISEKIDGYNFATIDKFNLYFQAKLKLNFNIPQIDKITVEHVIINEKYLLIVKVSPLSKDEQEAYIRPWQSQNFEYYIRSGPSDQRLDGPDLVEHIRQKENL